MEILDIKKPISTPQMEFGRSWLSLRNCRYRQRQVVMPVFFQNSVRSLKLKYVIDLADSQYQNVSLTDVEGFQEKKQQQDWASVTRHRAANAKPEVNRCCEACGARAAAVC